MAKEPGKTRAQNYIGNDYHIFARDARSAMNNATIIHVISLNGPLWNIEIYNKAKEMIGEDVADPSTFNRKIHDLCFREYLKEVARVEVLPGPKGSAYDLTTKGCVAALSLKQVRRELNTFLQHRDNGAIRLPGLKTLGRLIEKGVTPQLADHIIQVAVKNTIVVDFDIATQDEMYGMFGGHLAKYMNQVFTDPKRSSKIFQQLRITTSDLKKFDSFMRTDPKVREYLIEFKQVLADNRPERIPTESMATYVDGILTSLKQSQS